MGEALSAAGGAILGEGKDETRDEGSSAAASLARGNPDAGDEQVECGGRTDASGCSGNGTIQKSNGAKQGEVLSSTVVGDLVWGSSGSFRGHQGGLLLWPPNFLLASGWSVRLDGDTGQEVAWSPFSCQRR